MTATPTPTAAEVRASLSADELAEIWTNLSDKEREALQKMTLREFVDTPELNSLLRKKLFTWEYPDWQTHRIVVSALGRDVLAASPVTVAAVGEGEPPAWMAQPKWIVPGVAVETLNDEQFAGSLMPKGTKGVVIGWNKQKYVWEIMFEGHPVVSYWLADRFTTTATLTPATADEKPAAKYPEATAFGKELAAKHMGMVSSVVKEWAADLTPQYDWADFAQDVSQALGRVYDPETPVYEYVDAIKTVQAELAATRAALSAAEATADGYRAALKPFAEAAKNLIGPYHSGYDIEEWGVVEKPQGDFLGVTEITVRDLRAARAALADATPAPGEPDAEAAT